MAEQRVHGAIWVSISKSKAKKNNNAPQKNENEHAQIDVVHWFIRAPCIKKGVHFRVFKKKLSYEYPGVKTNGGSDLLERVLTGFSVPIF